MKMMSLFDKLGELKDKFKHLVIHKKKLKALENYSNCAPFQHKEYLLLIKRCMADGFLGDEEAKFLTYIIDKYQVNFLDWSHKTNWLKSEMQRLQANYSKNTDEQMTMFEIPKPKPTVPAHMPFEILAAKQRQRIARRI